MRKKGLGIPLWYPTPTAQYTRIRIGHVGYVRNGRFELLFDANRHAEPGNTKDPRVPGRDVPRGFVPLPVAAQESSRVRRSDRCEVVEERRGMRVAGAGSNPYVFPSILE